MSYFMFQMVRGQEMRKITVNKSIKNKEIVMKSGGLLKVKKVIFILYRCSLA
jgi:hypothetical protein